MTLYKMGSEDGRSDALRACLCRLWQLPLHKAGSGVSLPLFLLEYALDGTAI